MTEPAIEPDVDEELQPEGSPLEFPCSNCGADLRWDPTTDALSCEHCGHTEPIPREGGTIVERALADAGSAARGLGLALRSARCGECGAQVTFDATSTAEVCVYCGSPNVLAQESNRNAIRPESLVPLDQSRADVEQRFRRWLHKLWFRPSELKKTKRFDAVGIYVPFWTFDARVHSDWWALAGHYYYVTRSYTVRVNGRTQMRTRRVRKIRWVPASGARNDVYDDLLVSASKGLREDLVQRLGGFATDALVPYRPEYLAGWRAEEYQLDLEQAWDRGRGRIEERQRDLCGGDVPGDTYSNLRVTNRIADVRWKHVLLPIWSVQYRYGGKTYTVLVNGQSGRIVGKAPWSWIKIAGAVAAAVVAGMALARYAS